MTPTRNYCWWSSKNVNETHIENYFPQDEYNANTHLNIKIDNLLFQTRTVVPSRVKRNYFLIISTVSTITSLRFRAVTVGRQAKFAAWRDGHGDKSVTLVSSDCCRRRQLYYSCCAKSSVGRECSMKYWEIYFDKNQV